VLVRSDQKTNSETLKKEVVELTRNIEIDWVEIVTKPGKSDYATCAGKYESSNVLINNQPTYVNLDNARALVFQSTWIIVPIKVW
jgi:hypothetical protein